MNNADTAFHRSKLYRLLSYSFFYPTEELSDFLRSEDFIDEVRNVLEGYPVKADWETPLSGLRGLAAFTLEGMIDEHVRLLTLKSECPPYETDYYRSKISVFTTEEMADIGGFYRAVGMDFVKDRPDHIATQLEFMHLVTVKEAEAVFKGENEKAELCISLERKFLNDHLGRWVDAFFAALESQGSILYLSLCMLLRHWIDLDCRYLGVSPQKVADFKIEPSEDDEQMCLGRGV